MAHYILQVLYQELYHIFTVLDRSSTGDFGQLQISRMRSYSHWGCNLVLETIFLDVARRSGDAATARDVL